MSTMPSIFFYATVPLGFAIFDPARNGWAATTLTVAFIGTGSSFLAFAAIAAKQGLKAIGYSLKGFYFLGGSLREPKLLRFL